MKVSVERKRTGASLVDDDWLLVEGLILCGNTEEGAGDTGGLVCFCFCSRSVHFCFRARTSCSLNCNCVERDSFSLDNCCSFVFCSDSNLV